MKFVAIAAALLALNANAMFASAQEIESQDPRNQKESVALIRVYETAMAQLQKLQLQKFSDIAKRELLKETSARDLRFRCGRYWVDVYSKLISPDDREIGIWGVDSPAQRGMPAIQMRR